MLLPLLAAAVLHLSFDEAPIEGQSPPLEDGLFSHALKLGEEPGLNIQAFTANKPSGFSIHFWIKAGDCKPKSALVLRGPALRLALRGGSWVFTLDGAEYRMKAQCEESWTHLLLSAGKREVKLFVDGKLDSTHAFHGTASKLFAGPLRIGAPSDEPGGAIFEGLLDELEIDDEVVPAALIQELSRTPDQREAFEKCIGDGQAAHQLRCEETCGEAKNAAHCVFGKRKCLVVAADDKDKELCAVLVRECLHNAGSSGEELEACVPACTRRMATASCNAEQK